MTLVYRLPSFPTPLNIWRYSSYLGVLPPTTDPDVTGVGNFSIGKRSGLPMNVGYLLVPWDLDIRSSEAGVFSSITQVDRDLIEIEDGSGRYYSVLFPKEYSGLDHANLHAIVQVCVGYDLPPAPPVMLLSSVVPVGAINSVNQSYILPIVPAFLSVQLNGLTLKSGEENDYVSSGTSLTMNYPPITGDELTAILE